MKKSAHKRSKVEKMGGFEKYAYKTLRQDPQSRENFLENIEETPADLRKKIFRSFKGLKEALGLNNLKGKQALRRILGNAKRVP